MGALQVGDQDVLHASLDDTMVDDDVCRDRFLILYAYIDDVCADLGAFWRRKECSGWLIFKSRLLGFCGFFEKKRGEKCLWMRFYENFVVNCLRN